MLDRVAKRCRANNSLWLSHPEYAIISLKIDDAGQFNLHCWIDMETGSTVHVFVYHVFWDRTGCMNGLCQGEAQHKQQMFANIIKTGMQQ